jgi:hypothetical protein
MSTSYVFYIVQTISIHTTYILQSPRITHLLTELKDGNEINTLALQLHMNMKVIRDINR